MMKITAKVRGFRGIERADIDISPVALVGGLNYAGKSSLAEAIAAAACGTPIPYFRASKPDKALLTKTESKELVRAGMDAGSVELLVDSSRASLAKWPKLECEGDGRLICSKFAAGLISPMEMDDNERQKFFAELLKAMPNDEDLVIALMEAVPSLGDDKEGASLKALVESVRTSGFDPIYAAAKEKGARLKGQWEAHSGERYGSQKAEDWLPQGWVAELADISLEDIGASCTEAESAWQAAAAKLAVDQDTIAQLERSAKLESAAYEALQDAKQQFALAKDAVAKQKIAVDAIHVPAPVPCPHCGGMLDIKGRPVQGGGQAFTVSESEHDAEHIEALKSDRAIQVKRLAELQAIADKMQSVLSQSEEDYAPLKNSAEKLVAAKARQGTQEAVDEALDRLNGVRKDKAMIEAWRACAKLHKTVVDNQAIVDILAPEGLRRQKLVKALSTFNKKYLATLCGEADYPAVTLDDDLEILYGGRRYFLLSKSEKYRVQCILQVAIALYDKSNLVIFDGADILDAPGRNGLFALIGSIEQINFLVCMTVADKSKLPNLADADMGTSYWVNEGIAQKI